MERILSLINKETYFMIDIDGVCIDTIQRLEQNSPLITSGKMTWEEHVNKSKQINHSLDILRHVQKKLKRINFLTKNECLEEYLAKIKYVRRQGIYIPFISVPIFMNKSLIIQPSHYSGNIILIDDNDTNLKDWEKNGGISVFFDNGDNSISSKYPKIKSLRFLNDVAKQK